MFTVLVALEILLPESFSAFLVMKLLLNTMGELHVLTKAPARWHYKSSEGGLIGSAFGCNLAVVFVVDIPWFTHHEGQTM